MNGIDEAIRWIEINGIQHWKVSKSRGDKNDKAFETSDEDQLSARILQFRETMKLYPGNYFYITGKKNKTQTTGLYEYEFINGNSTGAAMGSTTQQPQVMGISDADVQKRIDEALEKAEVKRKIAELEKENKELRSENQTAATSLGKAITDYAPMIMGIISGKKIPQTVSLGTIQQQPQMQAVEFETIVENESQEVDEELTARVQNAIIIWSGADPEFIDTLEFIADFAANDGEVMGMKYAGIKNFLKK